ncbi:hypothetical protein [Rhizobium sp. Root1220]|uniref:hypothetical protein n=1 Tax=Rhizobium sp. Root1220 TaxID=1736432 RepID=UPI0006FE3216|nr:hypothetical protein [Rhizobium sp. Root1220]KQV81471.1 hypothetical protein ASC90_03905 [Rhizobium sp. Root1220]
MSATSEKDPAAMVRQGRSVEDLNELLALSRLITYAQGAAHDAELVGAMHWLELALQAVNREILDMPSGELPVPALCTAAVSRKTH